MPTSKLHAKRSRNKHIDYALVRRLLATGASQPAVARAVGCSQPNIAQWVTRNRKHAGMVPTPSGRATNGRASNRERASQ